MVVAIVIMMFPLFVFIRIATLLLNLVINVTVALILWIHNLFVCLFDLMGFPLVLKHLTALLSQHLCSLLMQLVGSLLGMSVKEWFDLVDVMVKLELFLTHVVVTLSEFLKLLICIPLLIVNVTLTLVELLLVLPVAIVLLRCLIKLLTSIFMVGIVVAATMT